MYTCLIHPLFPQKTLNDLYHKFKITMLAIITHQSRNAIGQAICDSSPRIRTYLAHPITVRAVETPTDVVRRSSTRKNYQPDDTSIQAIDPDLLLLLS